jgi:predicted small metal-binding protein
MAIAFVITCERCGLAVQGETRHEAVDKAAQHIEEWHPETVDDVTVDELNARVDEV